MTRHHMGLAGASLAALLLFSSSASAESIPTEVALQTDRSPDRVEGLPVEAPRTGLVIAVDTEKNIAYLFRDGGLVASGPAATGSNRYMKSGLREWLFRTPHGRQRVVGKIANPVWYKPDWAFIEEGKPVPPRDSPRRLVRGKLGKFALDLGDGILIHGTDEKSSLGRSASHGCIRLGDDLMKRMFDAAEVGTEVWVY